MKNNPFAVGATGFAAQHLPAGEQTETVLRLLRQGVAFDRREGKQPGFFHKYIVGIVAQIQNPTFSKLLTALELEAISRDQDGDSPIERVSRSFEFVRFHDPRKGEQDVSFRMLREYLTISKKEIARHNKVPVNTENDLPQCGHASQSRAPIKEKNYVRC